MPNQITMTADLPDLERQVDVFLQNAQAKCRAATLDSARAIRREAQARLARQTHGTGATAAAIYVEQHPVYAIATVIVGDVPGRDRMVPMFLEFGTRNMRAFPFLLAAAALESGDNARRIEDGLGQAIDET